MADRRRDRNFEEICSLAGMRAAVAWRTANALLPGATNRQLIRASRRILQVCDGRDRMPHISEAQCRELILPHMQCLEAQKERCPLLVFWEPVARSMNLFFHEEG